LGLALVKALSGMHGGEARIESKLGIGTTVRIRLPFAAVNEEGERIVSKPAVPESAAQVRIAAA
jgi:cell cycle sensor histidine kinase DivJ